MTRVVQAECPHCKRLLRIPADWVARQMKCKHCQQIFQARVPAEPNPRSTSPKQSNRDVAASTPLPPSPFSDLDETIGEPDYTPRLRSRRRSGGWWKGVLIVSVFAASACAILIFAGPELRQMLATNGAGNDGHAADNKPVKKSAPIKPDIKILPNPERDLFPRRALLINVSNYLLFNPLRYGNPRDSFDGKYPGSSTAVLADSLNRPPLNIPATQITELADGSRSPFSTSKVVIERTLTEFTETSRPQDRIIVLFTGHALDKDKEAYLVPVDGDRDDVKTLIPLAFVYDKLAKCKATQKVLILDVFRYPPARGEELPGTDDMTEDFVAKVSAPPAGVQVWTSCGKDQKSIELEGGSVFMQALCTVLQERLPGIQEPTMPLPLDVMVPKVNERLKEILAPQKLDQVSRLTGTHSEEAGSKFNPAEPLPAKLVLKVPSGGQDAAGLAIAGGIVEELNRLPPVRAEQKTMPASSLPAFSVKTLDEYKPDYQNWAELAQMANDATKYPLRAAVLNAMKVMKDTEKLVIRESLTNPGGPITPKLKAQFAATQKGPGMMIFEMEKILPEFKEANGKRDEEKSKRWLANYDFTMARFQERLVYLYEYDYILAQVRSDSLPALEPIHNGWRVGSQKKVQINEPKVKDMVKSIGRTWKRIAAENPGTPWAVLAKRESMTALGLVWRPSRD